MGWGWIFFKESEVPLVVASFIIAILILLLIEVSKMRREVRNPLTEIRDALKEAEIRDLLK